MLSKLGIVVMRLLARLPLSWLRALGWLLGCLLYLLAWPRRRVVWVNLSLCFPGLNQQQLRSRSFQTFVYFAQAWLDRSWLWHGSEQVTRQRLRMTGELQALEGTEPTVIFAPHFVGLDAGWTALTQQLPRRFNTIYTHQSNAVLDDWILAGRRRFGQTQLLGRVEGVKTIIAGLRRGEPLYLLPDMNFGPEDSVFVPFYGVAAATVPSLSRFAKLGRARVVPVVTRLTDQGYEVEVLAPWTDFPGPQLVADTALMNRRLQAWIDRMPAQYFWVHKRFKDRPSGQPAVY